MPTPVVPQEIAMLAALANLDLPAELMQELADAYVYVRRMTDRLPRDWQYCDEPAHVFAGVKFAPRER